MDILKANIVHIAMLLLFLSGRVAAQLSPGELSRAHKDLEGMTNCTQCHDLGSKVSNDKCLVCHKEIKTLINQNEGYHVSSEVRGKDCAKCHSDHHGRNFDMIRYDEKNFNHNLAGYELTGAHKKVDCRECHKPDYVADSELKKRKESFLGLSQKCNSCHEDVHQKTLGNDCAKCHTTDKFAPASKFNHDKSDFPLVGKHKTVECLECHQKETKNGKEFQKFSNVASNNCNSCHKDPHNDNLGTNCKECHNEQSFSGWSSLSRFNHSKTHFPLKGKHRQVKCQECHQMAATPQKVFQDRLGISTDNCVECHKDVHDGRFGNKCAECHNEDGFRKVGGLDNFDHNRTDFALKGKHEAVDCKKCHVSEHMTDPLPHNTCAECHKDFHEGQFAGLVTPPPDCATCHTVDAFTESSYTLEQHNKSKFPLEGAHVATPCFACHLKETKWVFRKIGERCVDCHKDVHNGQIDAKWYPNNACDKCHVTSSWRDSQFDHSKTEFTLKGAHQKQDCRACHVPDLANKYGKFADLPSACSNCHEEVHHRQFEEKGVTKCEKCHGNDEWKIAKFDHNKTAFVLDGQHAKVSCEKCHKVKTVDNESFVQYKFESVACAVCHQ